jgi:hypothetical protein
VPIDYSQRPTLRLVTDGEAENGRALTPFGPLRAGLITTQTTNEVALTELLNSLEKRIEDLQSKFSTVLDTFLRDTQHLVERGNITLDTTIIS